MTEAKLTWSIWQALLKTFAWAFTCRGFHRFAEWITAMALNVEEHTITQSVLALEQPAAWKALESFAEYGSWHQDRVTWGLTRLIATAPRRIWHGYHVSAVDDTKVHRSSPHVWGTCTFHEYTARCPNRAAPSAPTTGWSSAPCSPNPRSPRGSCRSPAGSTSASRSCRSDPRVSWNSTPSANWPSRCSASRPASSRASIWPFSTAVTPWRAWSGRWSCPQAAPSDRIPHPLAVQCPAVRLAPAPGAVPRGEAGTEAQVG